MVSLKSRSNPHELKSSKKSVIDQKLVIEPSLDIPVTDYKKMHSVNYKKVIGAYDQEFKPISMDCRFSRSQHESFWDVILLPHEKSSLKKEYCLKNSDTDFCAKDPKVKQLTHFFQPSLLIFTKGVNNSGGHSIEMNESKIKNQCKMKHGIYYVLFVILPWLHWLSHL